MQERLGEFRLKHFQRLTIIDVYVTGTLNVAKRPHYKEEKGKKYTLLSAHSFPMPFSHPPFQNLVSFLVSLAISKQELITPFAKKCETQ